MAKKKKDALADLLASMTDAEKAELLSSHGKSKKLVRSQMTLEEQAAGVTGNGKQMGPSDAAIEQLNSVLAVLFNPDVPYKLIPFWVIEIAYHWIQELDNPFARPWNRYGVRTHVRIWMVRKNNSKWQDVGLSVGRRIRVELPFGHRTTTQTGWCKTGTDVVNAETDTWPLKCLLLDKGGPSHANRLCWHLKDYGREHLREVFEEVGII